MNNFLGVISLTIFLSILALWSITLTLFKWKYHHQYPKTLHFLAGKPIVIQQQTQPQEEEHQKCCRLSSLKQTNNQIRIAFTTCIVLILTFSVLMQRPGMKILLEGLQSLESHRLSLYKPVHSAYEVTGEISRIESEIRPVSDKLLNILGNSLCGGTFISRSDIDTTNEEIKHLGNLKKEFINLSYNVYNRLSNVNDFQSNNNDGEKETTEKTTTTKISAIHSSLHRTIQKLNNIGQITINALDAFTTPFSSTSSYTDNDDDGTIHHLSKPIKILIKFSMVPIVILSSLFMAGTSFVWMDDSVKCVQRGLTYGVLPLFVMVVLMGGVALLIVVCSWSFWMDDMCSGNYSGQPMSAKSSGSSSVAMFFEAESNEERYFIDVMCYHESGCNGDNNISPHDFLDRYGGSLNDARLSVKALSNFLTSSSKVAEVCSECITNCGQLQSMIRTLEIKLQVLQGNVVLIPHLLDCQRFQSMYIDTLDSPACQKTKIGLVWIIVSLAIMIFSGMIVVTLRSSWLDDEIISHNEMVESCVDIDLDHEQLLGSSLTPKPQLNGSGENLQHSDHMGVGNDVNDKIDFVDSHITTPLLQNHCNDDNNAEKT